MRQRSKQIRTIRMILKRQIKGFKPARKYYGMLWEFHLADADNRPSVPHGHSKDGKYKLDPWTGIVYRINGGQLIECGKAKDITKLWDDKRFTSFARKAIDWYNKEFPYFPLEYPEQLVRSAVITNVCVHADSQQSFWIAVDLYQNQ